MKLIRKLVPILGILIGLWVLGSFVGVMVNIANPDFWTTSLMWSLLASLLVMPALVVAYHASSQAPRPQEPRIHESAEEPAPFVGDEGTAAPWPSPEARHSAEE